MNTIRAAVSLFGFGASVLSLATAGHPTLAQVLPPAASQTPGLGDLFADPGNWLADMFNNALAIIGQKTTVDMVGFMDWLMGSGNIISQTPAELSYDNAAVKSLWTPMRAVGFSALAAITVCGGVNIMVHPHIRAPYHGALELVPRVLLCGIMLNFSLQWGHVVIDLNNELCRFFGGAVVGGSSIPGWERLNQPPEGGTVLLNFIAMIIYLVMGLLLTSQMLMRLALVDVLLVIAPLALACWVLPQTYSWARLWFSTFFGTVFVQSIQVLVLQLGAALIERLPTLLPAFGPDPVEKGRVWLVTLLLGVAVLQLARKVPRLMPGFPA